MEDTDKQIEEVIEKLYQKFKEAEGYTKEAYGDDVDKIARPKFNVWMVRVEMNFESQLKEEVEVVEFTEKVLEFKKGLERERTKVPHGVTTFNLDNIERK